MKAIQTIKADFSTIPLSVKWVVLMFSLWGFGWGMVDPLFPLYLHSILENYALVWIFNATPCMVMLLLALPMGNLEDHLNPIKILKFGLLGHTCIAFGYYWFWLTQNPVGVLITLFFNGVFTSMVVLSARTFVKKKADTKRASAFAGMFSMTFFGFYALAMFIGHWWIEYYNLNSMFFIIGTTSFLAYCGLVKFFPPLESVQQASFCRMVLQVQKKTHIFKQLKQDLSQYGKEFYYALTLIAFVGIVEAMILTFIPLFASELHLSMSQICIIMWLIYLPYILSFLFAEIADHFERLTVSVIGLSISSITMFALFFTTNQAYVAVLCMLTALSLAVINPAAEGMVIALTPTEKRGEMSGVQSFFRRSWMFMAAFGLGIMAEKYGIHAVFFIIACVATLLALISIYMKHVINMTDCKKHKKVHLHWKIRGVIRHPLKH